MPTASVFKLPVLVEVFRQAVAGVLDLDERVTLRAEDVVMGSGILRDFGPGLQPSLRDLAMMMIIVSDNGATNLLLDRVGGPQRVNATMRALGLDSILIRRRIAFDELPDATAPRRSRPTRPDAPGGDAGAGGAGLARCFAGDAGDHAPAAPSGPGAPLRRLSTATRAISTSRSRLSSPTRRATSADCAPTPG